MHQRIAHLTISAGWKKLANFSMAHRAMIEQVETEMCAAAEKLDFKAAELRNLLVDLKRTTKPMTRFTERCCRALNRRKTC